MKRPLMAVVLLVTGSALASAQSVAPSADALELLKTVAQRYADAKSYHIEAVEERVSEQELERNWSKTILIAAQAPGNRFHYEGRAGMGDALQVSDGKTLSTYHANDHRYTSVPVRANAGETRCDRDVGNGDVASGAIAKPVGGYCKAS